MIFSSTEFFWFRLNARQLTASQGVEIFGGINFGMNMIARANRLAVQERWNVPHVWLLLLKWIMQ